MVALWLVAPIVSLVVMAAHFLRAGHNVVVASILSLALALILVPRRWVARLVQATLLVGAALWVRTLVELVRMRAHAGMPATRMAVILGSVAAVTALSALVFRAERVKRRYGLGSTANPVSK